LCYMLCPSHPPRLVHSNHSRRRVQGSSLCSFLHSLVTLSLFGPNILLSTLFPNTLSLCSSSSVRIQVRHSITATGKM
jgi:hypothetical protein